MSYLRYLCSLVYCCVQHILWCVFDLFAFVLGKFIFKITPEVISEDQYFFSNILKYTKIY